MSNVVQKTFGAKPAGAKGRKPQAEQAVFRLKVEGDQVLEFIEFLEMVYQLKVQVSEKDGTVLFFKAAPNRTACGIRVALRIYSVELLQLQEW